MSNVIKSRSSKYEERKKDKNKSLPTPKDEDIARANSFLSQAFIGFQKTRMISLGIRLGVFDEIYSSGGGKVEVIANKLGLEKELLNSFLEYSKILGLVKYKNDKFIIEPAMYEALKFQGGHANYLTGVSHDFNKYDKVISKKIKFTNVDRSQEYIEGVTISSKPTYTYLFEKIFPKINGLEEKLNKGAAILEPGFGGGFGLITLAKKYPNSTIHGVDISKKSIINARKMIKKEGLINSIQLHYLDSLRKNQKFDLILFCMTIHEIDKPIKTLKFYKDLLSENGDLIIIDGKSPKDFTKPHSEVEMIIRGVSFDENIQGTHFYKDKEMRVILESSGFTQINQIRTPDYPFVYCFHVKK